MRIESKTVLDRYQIRKSKAQKQAFRTYLRSVAQQQGYTTTEERGALGATNLIVGSPDTAKVVYTAHYDTCAVLPFPNFITPKNILLYLLYQLVVTVFLILPGAIAAGIAVGIGLVVEMGSLICADAGNSALGKTLQILGAIAVLWLSIPLINSLIALLEQILGDI